MKRLNRWLNISINKYFSMNKKLNTNQNSPFNYSSVFTLSLFFPNVVESNLQRCIENFNKRVRKENVSKKKYKKNHFCFQSCDCLRLLTYWKIEGILNCNLKINCLRFFMNSFNLYLNKKKHKKVLKLESVHINH